MYFRNARYSILLISGVLGAIFIFNLVNKIVIICDVFVFDELSDVLSILSGYLKND